MASDLTRRGFLGAGVGVAGTAVVAGTVAQAAEAKPAAPGTVKIIGVATSFRKGKTTAAAVQAALEAAKAFCPEGIETEFIDLAGMKIDGSVAAGIPLEPGQRDDFLPLIPKLSDPKVGGIILGTPVYFGDMSSLCKAFLERWTVFRKTFALGNKVGGVLAVGAGRNGGQEHTLRSVQVAMMGQQMIIVGDGKPTSHCGGTLWNNAKDDIAKDEMGMATAKNLGRHVAEVARALAGRS